MKPIGQAAYEFAINAEDEARGQRPRKYQLVWEHRQIYRLGAISKEIIISFGRPIVDLDRGELILWAVSRILMVDYEEIDEITYSNVMKAICLIRSPLISLNEEIGDGVSTEADIAPDVESMLIEKANTLFYTDSNAKKREFLFNVKNHILSIVRERHGDTEYNAIYGMINL